MKVLMRCLFGLGITLALRVSSQSVGPQPLRIEGTVRDADEQPAAGLRVYVFPGFVSPGSRSGAITDANGHYELTWNPRQFGGVERNFCLLVRDPKRNLAVARDIDEETTALDLHLEAGLTMSGRVENEAGKPLSGAAVSIILWAGNMGSSIEGQSVKTDTRGRFEINALPADRQYSASVTAPGYGSASCGRIGSDTGETNRLELDPFVLREADRALAGKVVDADDQPVASAWVHVYGEGQPNASVRSDQQGHFAFDAVCEGLVRLSASAGSSFGNAIAEGGETNVVIQLGINSAFALQASRRPSLKGRALPDLSPFGITAEAAATGKPLLICLLDAEQRPSRHTARLLAEQYDSLRGKRIAVLAIQAVVTSIESFQTWTNSSRPPFPVGRTAEKSAATKWATEVESLPWFILCDTRGKVAAEGFTLDELDTQLETLQR